MHLRGSVLLSSAFLLLACPAGTGNDDSSSSSGPCGDTGITDSCSDSGPSEAGDTEESGSTTQDTSDPTTDDGSTGETGPECVTDEDCVEGEEVCDEGVCTPICGDVEVVFNLPPPPVMLVLDKSGSMVNNSWDHDADPGTAEETRWATLYSVTDFILTNFESGIQFGLQLFPSTDATTSCANDPACPACDVAGAPEVGISLGNRDPILAAMPEADADSSSVAGATPAAGGLVNAKAALDEAVANGEENPALIFITDGAANCGLQHASELCEFPGPTQTSADCKLMDYFDDELEPLVAGYAGEGINTYVVGIDIQDVVLDPDSNYDFKVDDTNVYTELNAIAVAGGAPQAGTESFYNATDEAELMDALSEIVGELTECDIDLAEPPNMVPDPSQIPFVEVEIDGMDVDFLEISEAECLAGAMDGWIWLIEGQTVLFCGAACDSLKTTLAVDGTYGCPPPD
jgi:hypothetical protein